MIMFRHGFDYLEAFLVIVDAVAISYWALEQNNGGVKSSINEKGVGRWGLKDQKEKESYITILPLIGRSLQFMQWE